MSPPVFFFFFFFVVQPQRGRVHKSQGAPRAVWFTGTEGVTQQLVDLMHTGMDAFLTPSIALWVSDCLLSYFHLLPSSTLLFSLCFKREGDKASANLRLFFLAGLTGWSKSTPTRPGAHTNTRLCTCCQRQTHGEKNARVDKKCMCDQTLDTDGLSRSPASCPNAGVYTGRILRPCDVDGVDIMLPAPVQLSPLHYYHICIQFVFCATKTTGRGAAGKTNRIMEIHHELGLKKYHLKPETVHPANDLRVLVHSHRPHSRQQTGHGRCVCYTESTEKSTLETVQIQISVINVQSYHSPRTDWHGRRAPSAEPVEIKTVERRVSSVKRLNCRSLLCIKCHVNCR